MLTAALFCQLLREEFSVLSYRELPNDLALSVPVFYERGEKLEKGRIYVVRTQDLPKSADTACLFVCIGGRPSRLWSGWKGAVWFIEDTSLDILHLFNRVQRMYERVASWDAKMQELVDGNAEIAELVRASIPLFENGITITDYDLRVLVTCKVRQINGRDEVFISNHYDRIPNAVSISLGNTHAQNTKLREPYTYAGQEEYPEGMNYCINLFLGDTYVGTCTLWDRIHPLRESDYLLFQRFVYHIRQVLAVQSWTSPGQFVTLKAIFSELLQRFPVSEEDLILAVNAQKNNLLCQGLQFGGWRCVVMTSANKRKTLPEGYLCETLESMLPNTTAIVHDGLLVCFCMFPTGNSWEEMIDGQLKPYLRDMNFRAGISASFQDVFKVRDYYLQAKAIVETGLKRNPEILYHYVENQALLYMLQHCTGEFALEFLMSDGLLELRRMDGGVDYWETLRRYLDNECNASRTAQELYLHRSSILPRLEKIKSVVKMDTPDQRLYLRLILRIFEERNQK